MRFIKVYVKKVKVYVVDGFIFTEQTEIDDRVSMSIMSC